MYSDGWSPSPAGAAAGRGLVVSIGHGLPSRLAKEQGEEESAQAERGYETHAPGCKPGELACQTWRDVGRNLLKQSGPNAPLRDASAACSCTCSDFGG